MTHPGNKPPLAIDSQQEEEAEDIEMSVESVSDLAELDAVVVGRQAEDGQSAEFATAEIMTEAVSDADAPTGQALDSTQQLTRKHSAPGAAAVQRQPDLEELVSEPLSPEDEDEEHATDPRRSADLTTTNTGVTAKPLTAPVPTLRAALIGRDQELSQLKEIFLDSWERRRLNFVTLIGDAGSGKTRLAREFARSVSAAIPDARVLLGSSADAGGPQYAAIYGALAARFGIGHAEQPADMREKIARAVSETMTEEMSDEVTHLLASLMGVPFPESPVLDGIAQLPGHVDKRCYIAVRRFLEQDAQRGPLLLCFDAMDQARPETVALLHELADSMQNQPLMMLANARPNLFQQHLQWGEGSFRQHRIDLQPLGQREATALFSSLVHTDEIPPQLLYIIHERLHGSPRAIYDFARLLLERSLLEVTTNRWRISDQRLDDAPLPETHEAILRERLKSLPRDEKELLKQAAAVGETFWIDALIAIERASLDKLQNLESNQPGLEEIVASGQGSPDTIADQLSKLCDRGLVVPVDKSGLAGEREYRFAYVPLWDLAYELLEDKHRKHYQRVVALWLELRPEGRLGLRQEQIARLLDQAGDRAQAASRYRRAADLASARTDSAKALSLYRAAIDSADPSDLCTNLHLWHRLGSEHQFRGEYDQALSAYERMLRRAWLVASRPKLAVGFSKIGRTWRDKGEVDRANDFLLRALELFRGASDQRGIASALDDLAQVQAQRGDYGSALDQSAAALEIWRQVGEKRSIALSLSTIGEIERERGLFAEAEACFREALMLRRETVDRHAYLCSMSDLAKLELDHQRLDAASEQWGKVFQQSEELGAARLQTIALTNLGDVAWQKGSMTEAKGHLRRAKELAQKLGSEGLRTDAMRLQALLAVTKGNAPNAGTLLKECLDYAQKYKLRPRLGQVYLALAEVHGATVFDASVSTQEQPSAADRYFQQAVDVFRSCGSQARLARALRRLGEYRVESGRWTEGGEALGEALAIASKLELPDAEQLEQMLDDLSHQTQQ